MKEGGRGLAKEGKKCVFNKNPYHTCSKISTGPFDYLQMGINE